MISIDNTIIKIDNIGKESKVKRNPNNSKRKEEDVKKAKEKTNENPISTKETKCIQRKIKDLFLKYKLSIIVLMILGLFLGFYIFPLFEEPCVPIEGNEIIHLSTTLKTEYGIILRCRYIMERYDEGDIRIGIDFDNTKYFGPPTKDRIYIGGYYRSNRREDDGEISELILKNAYLEILNVPEPLKTEKDENGNRYYFNIEKYDKENNCWIYIPIGNILSTDYGRIIFRRNCRCYGLSHYDENATIESIFPTDMHVSFKISSEKNILFEGSNGSHRVVGDIKDDHTASYFAELDKDIDKIGLALTKKGIKVSVAFAAFGIIVAFFLYERRNQ